MRSLSIGTRTLSERQPCYVIAEIGVNHNGNLDLAFKLVDAAKEAGADAVKFQTFDPDQLVRKDARKAAYQNAATGDGTQLQMLEKLALQIEDFAKLKDYCERLSIDFLSTAFDRKSLDAVVALNPKALKWPSGELSNTPLLRYAAKMGKPLLISTGMADMSEVSDAVELVRMAGQPEIILLQCVSDYPAAIEQQNLRALTAMSDAFDLPVGFSDHTLGADAALAARALGICVLEKHITLDQSMQGPDHAASMEPKAFKDLIIRLRTIEHALGDGEKRPSPAELDTKGVARKSLLYRTDLPKGHVLTENDLIAKRPNDGLAPCHFDDFVGRVLNTDVSEDQKVSFHDVSHETI